MFNELKKEEQGLSPKGPENAEIYVLSDYPTEQEILIGKTFSGNSSEIFKTILNYLKIDSEKIRYNYVINYKVINEKISDLQINENRDKVFADIRATKPKVIIACGDQALKCLFNRSEPGIFGWRGHLVPLHEFNCWVVPTFSPRKIFQDGIIWNL